MDGDYGKLQRAYIADLRKAKKTAEVWWKKMTTAGTEDAIAEVRRRWPDGPASHPCVIAVFVQYMVACDALNQGRERHEQTPVPHFLMEAINTDDSEDLIDFTDSLTYWPLSHDAAERPV